MATFQVVKACGPFQGLPTYFQTSEVSNLTAIVTGANGMSGYHMVRVLAAAPRRWSRIYCLSRRPPPSNFFADLGEGAKRVKHICVDFLADQTEIANQLKREIERVYVLRNPDGWSFLTGCYVSDYVCFFSYAQPLQGGSILGMGSAAEELAKINGTLLRNFLSGLQHSGLQPKRFLLQTGAKHYGFHIGPATNPSFESDPRIELEANFYYPQEDALLEYCNATGVTWNVVRPSYIIGAVRGSALNHMVGLSIYASIQAYLREPLAFPGDHAAWDRECCQSTAWLNGYFEEWALLTDEAANEAFNIQDGLPFTWGRFWTYLADWYGTSWMPPEVDESKYRVRTSRYVETPRGYGPIGVTRSTFSLQEWSEGSQVQAAWKDLAEKHGLGLDPFTSKNRAQIFGMTDSAVIGGWALSLSMRKARSLGFLGTVDSYESAFDTMKDLARLKVVVPLVREEFTSDP